MNEKRKYSLIKIFAKANFIMLERKYFYMDTRKTNRNNKQRLIMSSTHLFCRTDLLVSKEIKFLSFSEEKTDKSASLMQV